MKHYFIITLCITSLLASSCSTPAGPNDYNDTLIGAGGGALLGGLIGSGFGGSRGALLGAGLGALAGGFVGHEVGQSQDQAEANRYKQSRYNQERAQSNQNNVRYARSNDRYYNDDNAYRY